MSTRAESARKVTIRCTQGCAGARSLVEGLHKGLDGRRTAA